jgi:D-alanyl-D-alanine dipeptidase
MPQDLVEIKSVIPDALLDVRYATSNNLTGQKLYQSAASQLRKQPLQALKKAADDFRRQGLQLVIWDGYRPVEAQAKLRAVCDDSRYVAKDSNHTKGITVDITLARDGQYLDMGTGYDEFSNKAHANAQGLSAEQRQNRALLRDIMTKQGFTQLAFEWWHFDYLQEPERVL